METTEILLVVVAVLAAASEALGSTDKFKSNSLIQIIGVVAEKLKEFWEKEPK